MEEIGGSIFETWMQFILKFSMVSSSTKINKKQTDRYVDCYCSSKIYIYNALRRMVTGFENELFLTHVFDVV